MTTGDDKKVLCQLLGKLYLPDKIDDDKFNKEYKYNIRHSYGLEGKRANYPARR